MRRAAWINQVVAAWLIGFVVFGLPDSTTASELACHGAIALLLLLASWRVLASQVGRTGPSIIQAGAGLALVAMPAVWRHPVHSFVALNDLTLGIAAVIDAVVELMPGRRAVQGPSQATR